ncbi:antibiotic biosynthesis monooxygenase [Pseudomonas aeruginosa]
MGVAQGGRPDPQATGTRRPLRRCSFARRSVRHERQPGNPYSRAQWSVGTAWPAPATTGRTGLEAPGCLEYQVRRDALEPDLWLVCSQWREAQQMFDYLAGGIQQVFAEVLWRSLAASLEVQDDAG